MCNAPVGPAQPPNAVYNEPNQQDKQAQYENGCDQCHDQGFMPELFPLLKLQKLCLFFRRDGAFSIFQVSRESLTKVFHIQDKYCFPLGSRDRLAAKANILFQE